MCICLTRDTSNLPLLQDEPYNGAIIKLLKSTVWSILVNDDNLFEILL